MAEIDVSPGSLDGLIDIAVSLLAERLYDPAKLARVEKVVQNGVAKGATIAQGAAFEGLVGPTLVGAQLFEKISQWVETLIAPFLVIAVSHMLGIEVTKEQLRSAAKEGPGGPIGQAMAGTFMKALSGPEGQLEPSDERARGFLAMLGNFTLQSWFEGILFEHVVSEIPGQDAVQATTELAKRLIDAMGLNRLARVALRPLAQTTIATPLEWKVHKAYRPTLLGPSTVLRQFVRGRWDWADVEEELARAGYSSERIDALLNEQLKFLSESDLAFLVWNEIIDASEAIDTLKNVGWDEQTASKILNIDKLKREDMIARSVATDAIGAYVDRTIDDAELRATLDVTIPSQNERARLMTAAQGKRAHNIKVLSAPQALACVKAGILNVIDYRRALEREGYTPDAVEALELLLRHELDEKAAIDELRAKQDAERAAEKKARDDAAAAKRAEVEAANALHRRGSISDLRAAVVRGLIPISRLEEVLAATYDADTVAIYVATVEDDRQAYLDQQQRAADARQRAARKGLNVGQVEASVLEGVLTVDEFSQRLTRDGYDPADVHVLTATLAAKKKAIDDARAKRLAADLAASTHHIDLTRFEQLVRRGHRTIAEYDALLQSLDFDDASRAALVELLNLKIADDRAAEQIRADAALRASPPGLSLAELRRAVILGLKSVDDFDAELGRQKYTVDARAVLVAELRDDVAAADAARTRRAQSGGADAGSAIPLARVRLAAQLGIVAPDEYARRLAQAGYSADDIALETDLLLHEIADVQAQRAARQTLTTAAGAKAVPLADVARAVKLGVRSIDDYRAAAVDAGFDLAGVNLLVAVLAQEALALKDAKNRRTQIAAELIASGVALGDLEDKVRSGEWTIGDYAAALAGYSYDPADVDFLAALLTTEMSTHA